MKSPFARVIGWVSPIQLQAEGLALTVAPLASTTVVGEPVVLRCTYANDANTPAALDLGFNDVMKISFVLNPDGQSPVALTQIQQGGGGDWGTRRADIAAHQRITRYVVLNQWFRPAKAGVYSLEMVVKAGDRTITARFQITVADGNAAAVETRAEGMVQRYLQLRAAAGNSWNERANYKHTLLMAFTYLHQAFPQILEEVGKRHGDNGYVTELVEAARSIGPGGSQVLD
jgi:hypothetical protein